MFNIIVTFRNHYQVFHFSPQPLLSLFLLPLKKKQFRVAVVYFVVDNLCHKMAVLCHKGAVYFLSLINEFLIQTCDTVFVVALNCLELFVQAFLFYILNC